MNQTNSVENLFLDNQSHIYIFEKHNPIDANHFQRLHDERKINLVLSLDNLVEFSQSDSLEQALNLTESVLAYNPKWIDSFLDIQRQELRHFIYNEYLKHRLPPYKPYRNNFFDLFDGAPVTPKDFVAGAFEPKQKEAFRRKHQEHANVVAALQNIQKAFPLPRLIEDITLNNVVISRLSQTELDQLGFSLQDKRELVRFCLKNRKHLYKQCPSLNTERHISDYRSSNPKRKPCLSDSFDLTMSVAALPYVDIFITNDGFLCSGLKYVKKKIPSMRTEIFRSLCEVPLH